MWFGRANASPRPTVGEILILTAILVAIGVAMVPCHWTSTWADEEFTGWVVPIANRLAGGQLLYTDGGHLPLPPLSFVLASLLFGSHGIWLSESALNFTFQCLAIVILYVGLSRRLPRPVPFLAALATMPIFFSLAKTIAYDAIAQALASLVAVTALVEALPGCGRAPPMRDPAARRPHAARRLVAVAAATAACVLAKQSTGFGAALGVCGVLVLFPRTDPLRQRMRRMGAYVAAVIAALLLGCVVLSPFMSISGFVTDVFVTGSEPKGGSLTLLANLYGYISQIWGEWTPTMMGGVLALVILGTAASRWSDGDSGTGTGEPDGRNPRTLVIGSLWLTYVAALAGVAGGLFAVISRGPSPLMLTAFSPIFGFLPGQLLSAGLFLCLLLVALAGLSSILPDRLRPTGIGPLVVLSLVLFSTALFHSLSDRRFRWTYDNNPLIMMAVAALIALSWRALRRLFPRARVAFVVLTSVGAFALQLGMWSTPGATTQRVRMCTETWPEVRYLRGAKLMAKGAGMRDVAHLVRQLAPNATDTVLLLPEDPNVESWFERPRPALSGAIVFVDQYWDRYVDVDFARLERDPPKVIVIGPRYHGRFVQLFYHGNTGAARLIERVDRELLPRHYRLLAEQKIKINVKEDFMDIYVRVEDVH